MISGLVENRGVECRKMQIFNLLLFFEHPRKITIPNARNLFFGTPADLKIV